MVIPPQVRAILYWVWVGLYLAVLVTDTIFRAIGGTPDWLGPLAEWLLLVGAAIGFVAAGNTKPVVVDPTALPPAARKVIYTVLSAISLLVFLASEGFRLMTDGDPWWIDVANGILLILSFRIRRRPMRHSPRSHSLGLPRR